jgi:hypothetical protein
MLGEGRGVDQADAVADRLGLGLAYCHQPPRRKLRASWSKLSGASSGP